jgi:N-acetylglucosaminyldiphosphoundecaprenol N-acetyl-beta-D-mannosaminyltransferase
MRASDLAVAPEISGAVQAVGTADREIVVPRVNVLGVGVSATEPGTALSLIGDWIANRTPRYVCVSGVHGIMESLDDPSLRAIHNRAGLVTPDGMPLVWLGRLAGHRGMRRVYGPDLLLACCAESERRGWRHFFYGGGDGVAELVAKRLHARFPTLQVAGTYTPPFRELTIEEEAEVAHRIEESCADIVWVGLSTPKQERWMSAHVGRIAAPVLVGVGAAFDFHAGLKPQAPRWIQQSGLEWLFRLATEPRRLWRRYLKNNPRFAWHVVRQSLGTTSYDLSSP